MILPDIEKRLEAFVRVGHGVIIFPGGAGTAEEFLYLLGILHPDNQDRPSRSSSPVPAAPKPTCSSSMNSSGRPSAMRRSATTGSSSTTRPRWQADGPGPEGE